MYSMLRPKLLFGRLSASFSNVATAPPRPSKKYVPQIVEARNKNLDQSPLRMKFLVSLVRGLWVPDAMAQLKFSPKHKAVEVGKMMQVSKVFPTTVSCRMRDDIVQMNGRGGIFCNDRCSGNPVEYIPGTMCTLLMWLLILR